MKILNTKAFSIVEYVLLFVVIMGTFIVMRGNVQRGIFGIWKQPGDSFSFGRQYDPQKTADCNFDDQTNVWYDHYCFISSNCIIGNADCEKSCQASGCTAPN